MNIEKIEEVVNSYYNGQKKQMVNQIKSYGQAKFFIDFFECQEEVVWSGEIDLYSRIVYTFFMLKHLRTV